MEPLLLGLALPSITSTAGQVGRAVTTAGKSLVSSFADLLQVESQPDATAAPQAVKIGDIQSRAESLQKNLEQRLAKVIADSNVQLGDEVRLRVSEFDGALEADALASPDRQILEAALASDPTLADDFRTLAALRKVLAAAEDNEPFAAAYTSDPRQAIADFTSRFQDHFEDADRFEAVLRFSSTDATPQLAFE